MDKPDCINCVWPDKNCDVLFCPWVKCPYESGARRPGALDNSCAPFSHGLGLASNNEEHHAN